MLTKLVQTDAKKQFTIRTHLKIKRVVDGDGIIVTNLFNNQEEQIRLLGIDAPELKRCRKLNQDERETHLAAQFLMQLARQSFAYLSSIAPANAPVKLLLEANNTIDVYGRTLAYVYLSDGVCLNERMIAESYAKPFDKYYCNSLGKYQKLNSFARVYQRGLYQSTSAF